MSGIGSWFSRKRATASRTAVSQPKADKRRARRSGIMALEPRIMYDGAAAATASHSHHHDHGSADIGHTPPPSGNAGNSFDQEKHGRNDTQPMPQVTTAVKAPSEILFIDSQVPDYQSLASGAKPGVEVVVLNPNSDGLQQIADFLSRHPDPNLTTIDIVAHGASGEMMLGSTDITDANLSTHAAALAQIGAALGPNGAIELYSCNVASGTPGLQFISDLSKDAGGADVVASTHNLGQTASGENWTLDAATGALKTASPFTAAAMAGFQGLLGGETQVNQPSDTATAPSESAVAALPNGDYVVTWVGTDPATFDGEVLARFFDANGNAITINGTNNDLVLTDPNTINVVSVSLAALPAVAGNTQNGGFVIAYEAQNAVTGADDLVSEVYGLNVAGTTITKVATNQVSTDTHDTDDAQNNPTIAVNANGSYIVAWEQVTNANGLDNRPFAGNIEAQIYNSSDAAVGGNFQVNGTTATTVETSDEFASATALTNGDFAIAWNDTANNEVLAKVFTPNGGVVTSDFVVSTNSAASGDGTSIAGLATSTGPDSGGYVATWTSTGGQVFARMFSAAGVGGAAIQVETAATSEWTNVTATPGGGFLVQWNVGAADVDARGFDASGNPTSSVFQVDNGITTPSGTVAEISTGGQAHDTAAVLKNGQVVVTFDTTQISSGTDKVWVDQFDDPQLSTSASTVTYDQGGSPVTIDQPGVGISISGVNQIASATVSITTHFQSGDVLGIPAGDLTSGTVTGTNITESYNSSTGVLTLSGLDNVADYQKAMAEVTFSSTVANLSVNPRTISFTVASGQLSATATDTVDVHDQPVVTAGATISYSGGGNALTVDSGVTVTDPSSSTLASATVSISGFVSGDTLTVGTPGSLGVSYDSTHGILTLTGSASSATYQTALESIKYSFTGGSDPTGGGTHTSRTIDWVVNDGTLNSATATSTVNITHTAPTVTAGGSATFTGGGSAQPLDPGITVNDVDSGGTLATATVKISSGYITGDTLNYTQVAADGNIQATSNANGQLVLSSAGDTATLAQWDAALQSITYSFASGGDPTGGSANDTSRTISWTVTDGSTSNGTSNTSASTLTTVHVAPTVTAGASASYSVGGGAVAIDGALSVSDVDSGGNLTGATVSIGTGFVSGADQLIVGNAGGLTVNYTASTGILTLTGSASLTTYQTALESITFSTSATTAGSRTIDWVVQDGAKTNGSSAPVTSTVQVLAGPQLSGTGTTVNYQETGGAVTVDSALTLTDPTGANIASATVSINGFVNGNGDVLGIPTADLTTANNVNTFTGTNITESYNSATGVLTLSGSDTAAHYTTALDAITYTFSANPVTAPTTRTLTYSATDTNGISTAATGDTNTIDLVHTAPSVTVGTPNVTFTGGGSAQVLDSALTLSDPDSGNTLSSATVSIGTGFISGGDTLTINGQTSGTITDANGVIHYAFTGSTMALSTQSGTNTVADYQAALRLVNFNFTSGGDPTNGGGDTSRAISWQVNDGATNNAASNVAPTTLTVVHAAPTVTAGSPGATFTGGGSAQPLDNVLTLSDPDSGNTLSSATVSIGTGFISGGDTLTINGQTSGTITDANGVIHYAFTGSTMALSTQSGTNTVADYQAALRLVNFNFTSGGDPTNGGGDTSRAITWTVTDEANASASDTSSLTVVHAAPMVTAGSPGATFTGGGAQPLDNVLTLSDLDSGNTLSSATVSIGTGFISGGDTLTINGQQSGTITDANGVIQYAFSGSTMALSTLSGTNTVADYQAALRLVNFNFTSGGDPTNGGGDTSRAITWTVTDEANASASDTSSLTVVHAAPTVTAGNPTVTFTGGGSAQPLDSGIVVTDLDSGNTLSSATVSIGTGFISGGDTLTINGQQSGTITDANGVIQYSFTGSTMALSTKSGTNTVADYQAALRSVNFNFTSGGDPTNGGGDTSRTISWSVTDEANATASDTSTLNVTHVAPTVTAGNPTVTFTGGGSAQPLDSGIVVTDLDSGNTLSSATVSIGTGFISGSDTLTINGQQSGTITDANGVIQYSFTGSTMALSTKSGTNTVADYQAALRSVNFNFTSGGDPTNGGGDTSRAITWTVTDEANATASDTSTLNVTHVAPTVTAGAAATYETGSPTGVTLDNTLTVSDPDSGGSLKTATVSISGFVQGDGDTLSVGNADGLTFNFDTTSGVLTLTGPANGPASLTAFQTALDSVAFSTTSTTTGIRTLDWSVTDGSSTHGSSNTATSTVNVINGPLVTAGAAETYTQGQGVVALDPTLTITDPVSNTLTGATVSISAGTLLSGDTLNFTNQGNIAVLSNTGGVLTLTGTDTVADYQTALESISYSFTNGDPTKGGTNTSRSISWTVSDGTVTSAPASSTLTTVASTAASTNVVILPSGTTATFDQGGSAVLIDPNISVTDSAASIASASVTISGNFQAGDVLGINGQTSPSGTITDSDASTIGYQFSGQTLLLTTQSGTATATDYQTALGEVTFSSTAAPLSIVPRSVTFSATDTESTPVSGSAVETVDILDQPVVHAGTPSVTFTGGGSPTTLDSGLTLSDPSTTMLSSATVSISGFVNGDGDVLGIPAADLTTANNINTLTGTNITESYNSATGVLTLSGPDTVAHYQTALQEVQFSFTSGGDPTNGGGDTSRTISWQVTDDSSPNQIPSNAATTMLGVAHTAPTVTAGSPGATFTGGGSAQPLDNVLTLSDPDSGNTLSSATVSIGTGFISGGDTLTINGQTSGTITDANGVIHYAFTGSTMALSTQSGTNTVADYQAALRLVNFNFTSGGDPTNGGGDVSRAITWTVTDEANASASDTSSLTVVHAAPTVTAGSPGATFTGGGGAQPLDNVLTLSDLDSGNTLSSATVSIGTGFISGGDTLTINGQQSGTIADANGVIQYSFTGSTMALSTQSGTNTVADYQAALRSVDFNFTSGGDPTNGGGDTSRAITWTVTDEANASASDTSSLTVVHAAPMVTAGSPGATFTGGGAQPLDNVLTLSDLDSGNTLSSATVSIGTGFISGGDTLTINGQQSGTITDANGVIQYAFSGSTMALSTLSGTNTVADYQAALRLVNFNFTSGGDPTNGGGDTSRAITWTVTDEANASASDTSSLTVVHAAPTVTAGNPTVTFTGGGSAQPLDSGIVVTDLDSGNTLSSATVSIGTGFISGGDTLTINGQQSGTITDANGVIQYSFTGSTMALSTKSGTNTVADYQAALRSVNFNFTSGGDPTNGGGDTSRTISWSVTDEANATASDTSTLNVTHVAPTVTAGNPTVTFTGGGSAQPLDSGIVVTDADSGNTLSSATVSIGTGFISGSDTLTINGQQSGTITDANGVIQYAFSGSTMALSTLSGTNTVADYQAALRLVNFNFTSGGDPTNGGGDTSRAITWTVTDEAKTAGSDTSSLNVVHAAPTVTAGSPGATFTGGGSAQPLDNVLILSDPDSGNTLSSATVSIGTGFISGGDTLTINGQQSGTIADANGVIQYAFTGSTMALSTKSGTNTVADYQAALRLVDFNFTSGGDPTNGGGDTSRTITWTVTDEAKTTGSDTSSLTVVHAAPTLSAGGTVTYIQGGSAAQLDGGLTLSAPDSGGNLQSATVSINGFVQGDGDKLSVGNADGLSTSFDSTSGVLTLTGPANGPASQSAFQTALDSVTFSSTSSNPTSDGADPTRTITWTINDGVKTNTITQTSTVDVHALPVVTAGTPTVTFTGGGSPVPLDSGITVSDASSTTLASATVTINNALTGDTLNFSNVAADGDIQVTSNSGGQLVLTSTNGATLAQWDAALGSITYSFTNGGDPTGGGLDTSRTISWQVYDGTAASAAANSTLTTAHRAPTVTPSGATATFEGGSTTPVQLDSGIIVNDVDSNNALKSATVTIGNSIAGDTLNFTKVAADGDIQLTSNSGGQLVLTSTTGTATLTQWDAALESITYSFSPTNGDPTNGGGDTARTISWQVTDGSKSNGASTIPTSTLDTVHMPPVLTAGSAVGFEIGAATQPVTLDSGLTVSDADSLGNLSGATVSIGLGFDSTNDTLSFNNGTTTTFGDGGKITSSYDATHGILSLTGTASVTDYQTALDSVTFRTTTATAGNRTIDWTVTDGVSSSVLATSSVAVSSGPQLTAGGTVTFVGGGAPATLDSTLTVTDQNSPDLVSASATISSGLTAGDTLSFNNGATKTFGDGGKITATYDATHGILSLTGTASATDYQTALDQVQYSFNPANADPTAADTDIVRTITWGASDGVANKFPATSTLDVVHAPPTLTTGGSVTYIQAGSAATLDGTLKLSDPDSGGLLTGATVQISSGFFAGDTLSADTTGRPSITASYNSSSGQLTLSGSDTLADYQAVLRSVTFSSTSANPTDNATDPTRTLTWTINDGVSTNPSTETSIVKVHALPIVTPSGVTATFTQGGSAQPLDSGLTVVDNNTSTTLSSATVSIGTGFISGDTLGFVNQNGITGSYNAATGVLSLSGTASAADYQTALDSITFSSNIPNPSNDGADASRTITWSVSDGLASSTAAHSTLGVQAVPTVVAGADVKLQAGPGQSVALDPALGAYDGVNLTSATVSIVNGMQPGDTLSANTTGTNIHASYANGTLTLTGSDTPQDYDAVLKSVAFGSSQSQSGQVTIDWQVSDPKLTSAVATSTVETTGNLAPPPSQNQAGGSIPATPGHGQFGDFSQMVTTANLQPGNVFTDFSAFHADVTVIHVDVQATLGDNGAIAFNLPLDQLDAVLGGDVVSVSASLADGQPLPPWLQFNGDTGQFAGLLPDTVATGSIGSDGGNGGHGSQPLDSHIPSTLFQKITIEVVARDSQGNLAITDFTIDLSALKQHGELKPHGGERHGWNVVPDPGFADPWTTDRRGRDHDLALADLALGSHRDIATLHAMDRVLWHDASAIDIERGHGHPGHGAAPAGRAGLSDQIKGLGWHAAAADRLALLESLRQGVAGWR